MKKHQLLSLLLLTLLLQIGATSPLSAQAKPSGIESETASRQSGPTMPSWAEVLPVDPETARIIGEEIDQSLEASWNEGYKAARVEFEQQIDYWMTIAQAPLADRFWDGVVWGAVPGFFSGFVAGVVVVLSLTRAVR